jgi:hypothetical protein
MSHPFEGSAAELAVNPCPSTTHPRHTPIAPVRAGHFGTFWDVDPSDANSKKRCILLKNVASKERDTF